MFNVICRHFSFSSLHHDYHIHCWRLLVSIITGTYVFQVHVPLFCSYIWYVLFLILPIYQEFNHGVEFVLLISFNEDALGNQAEHALASLASIMLESPFFIVQFTHGMLTVPPSLIQLFPCYLTQFVGSSKVQNFHKRKV